MILSKRERHLRSFISGIRAQAFGVRVPVPLELLFSEVEQRMGQRTAWQAVRLRAGANPLTEEANEDPDADLLRLGVRTVIRVADFARDERARLVTMLLQWVDLDEADPAFSRLADPGVRVPDRARDEGRTHSAHLVFAADDTDGEHPVVVEDAARLSPTRVDAFLRHMLRGVGDVEVSDGDRRRALRKPVLTFEGIPETKLKDELASDAGLLNSIELVRRRPTAERLDEPGEYEEEREIVRIKPVSQRSRGEAAQQVIERVLGRAREEGFEKFRIRYTTPRDGQKTVSFDTNTQDALERAFVKKALVELDEDLAECVAEIQPQIVRAARGILDI